MKKKKTNEYDCNVQEFWATVNRPNSQNHRMEERAEINTLKAQRTYSRKLYKKIS